MQTTILKIIILILLVVISLMYRASAKAAEAPDILLQDKPVPEIITHFAKVYNQDADVLLAVAHCESNFKPLYGDGGDAFGAFQFHKPTFERYEARLGEDLDYYSAYDQAKLASYVFSRSERERSAWTCYTKLYK